ncbi:alpha/beta hydrolase [Solibacillus sp. R5-41]|uniref:alpha/beta fold hydrolase n=1 Tax=Solibacillus sp. R5-41 TaxID=2048654 RepID=UPI000C127D81|nr:alpha/beta hydrolase [Solibacillus sp. R5-41]ATP40155.1 alpha/beta hydrolase [Solibacillus sp. R5-41]
MQWEQQLIETARGTFEIFKTGQGQPICVTHLYSEFNERGSRFASMFADYCTVYLVNLRGCGHSTNDTSIYNFSMQDSVADLEAIRQKLGFENWGFAGNSTGGMLALTYAIHAPQSLQYIVAGGLCASSDYMRHPASIYCKENPNNKRILEIIEMLGNPNSKLEQRQAGNKEWSLMSLYKEESFDNMISRPSSGKTVSKRLDYFSYVELPHFDLRPQLPNTMVKSYIFGGKYDAQCPHDFAVEAANLIPHATLTTFEQSNHYPFIEEEQEFESFVDAIFIEETTG